jgi:RNA polymerase I-specific transcription initiation factor RRN5
MSPENSTKGANGQAQSVSNASQRRESSDTSGDSATTTESESCEDGSVSRKRKRSSEHLSKGALDSNFMTASDSIGQSPSKLRKRSSYVDVLNRDIHDAESGVRLDDFWLEDEDSLPAYQLGLSVWTATERRYFFEALARVGRDDVQAISARIGTKSELEVQQYILLLNKSSNGTFQNPFSPALQLVDFPAAKELSKECCDALEEEADAVSTWVDQVEGTVEQKRWGELWVISEKTAKKVDDDTLQGKVGTLPFAELLRLSNWIRLSNRVFLNGPFPDQNWRSMPGRPPSMRATAFGDFHNLALALTRKLVYTTLVMSEARNERKQTVDTVRRRDVEAAVASLGLPLNSKRFWAKCPRKVGLEIYRGKREDEQPMSYDAVERKLGLKMEDLRDKLPASNAEDEERGADVEFDRGDEAIDGGEMDASDVPFNSASENESMYSDYDDDDNKNAEEGNGDDSDGSSETPGEGSLRLSRRNLDDSEEVKQDVDDLKQVSSINLLDNSLLKYVKTEHDQVAFAEAADQRASQKEEQRMWRLLRKDPPPQPPESGIQKPTSQTDDDKRRPALTTRELYPQWKHWRSVTEFYSEWEMVGQRRRTGDLRRGRRIELVDKEQEAASEDNEEDMGDESDDTSCSFSNTNV